MRRQFLKPRPNPKIAHLGPKDSKSNVRIEENIENKMFNHLSRPQKGFSTLPDPKNGLLGLQKV